ncbi:MAG: hypothetical protein DHS20C13_01800 [Thermodesulfobacteriota bacterium]|nr:MAG: hypothetical protein DHS20C13_01800 [Thermodesulfobacteriota bacterium]
MFLYRATLFLGVLVLTLNSSFAESVINSQTAKGLLGIVEFETSCSDSVGEDFNRGVALLHHMMYKQAEQVFTEISEKDPDCAMAYWGLAMTQVHPLWAPPSKEELAKGLSAVKTAKSKNPQTEREQDYISAVEGFYDGFETKDHPTRIAIWEENQKKVMEANPNDVDAAAFYALSHLATAPKADKTFAHQKESGALLEELYIKAPEHPGVFHYTIHAYDNPVLAERAVPVAKGYDKLAPDVPHALHMPSHIFVRLGMWPEVINWNIRSADAAKRQSPSDAMSLHYAHAADYLIYSYLQKGQDKKAMQVLTELNEIANYQDSFASAYGIAGAQARYPLERMQWEEAAALKPRTHENFEWGKYPQYEAISYFAQGIGAARSGNIELAETALAKLNALYDETVKSGDKYWPVIVDADRQSVAAWIEYAKGDKNKALAMMEKAADTEDSVDKHPVTPGAILPARDLLGDMLIDMGKPAMALVAYEKSLQISPNRFYSLYGAGYAAELSGNSEKATKYYQELINVAANADSPRPRVDKAKEYLSKNQS